jgi:signal transduction histidine kinase/CheY-like chemotaxis protein
MTDDTEKKPLTQTQDVAPAAQDRADLIGLTGELAGRRFTVTGRFLIGRDAEAAVRLGGDDVSRRHACITRTDSGEFILEDLKSRNGTMVNGRPVEMHVLRFGDTIQIGLKALFVFTHHRQALEEQLVRWQRLELIAQMTAGLVHDFRNYMTAILGYIQYLQEVTRRDTTVEELKQSVVESVEVMESAAWEGVNLTRRVLTFAKGADQPREPTPLKEIVDEATRLVGRSCPKKTVLKCDVPPGLHVVGNRTELLQILVNLYLNARDAMPEGGTITTEASLFQEEGAGASEILLKVTDTGVGMDTETQRRAFEPLFTTKDPDKGTGLGLSTVARLVENHRGHIHVDSALGQGSSFLIFLPAAHAPEAGPDADTMDLGSGLRPDLMAQTAGFVLLVNDDELVRQRAVRALRPLRLEVLCAPSGPVAIDLYERYHDRIRLVVLDLDVTGAASEETYRQLRKTDSNVRVLVATGANVSRAGTLRPAGARTVLEWRSDTETIARTFSDALR